MALNWKISRLLKYGLASAYRDLGLILLSVTIGQVDAVPMAVLAAPALPVPVSCTCDLSPKVE